MGNPKCIANLKPKNLTPDAVGKCQLKIIKINTNISRPAHDMALAIAKELGADVLLFSEPNRNTIRHGKDWYYDVAIDTAIKI